MILRYATNLKLAKELYNASKPKLQGTKVWWILSQTHLVYQLVQLN